MDTTESDYYQFMDFDAENARTVLSYYTQFFRKGPVLELASGPGVFLTLLRQEGIEAFGVDIDDGMVEASSKAGHTVVLSDAIAHLKSLPDASLEGLFAAHFLEHLSAEQVQEVYEQAARVLHPGARFVAAVPNAACLSVLGYDFWRDPTHVRFYDPVALQFFAKQAGLSIIASGGNPNNHPGPPPHLRSGPPSVLYPIASELTNVVDRAGRILAGRGRSPAKRGTEEDTDANLWSELGHLINVLDRSVQTLQHDLETTRKAYENLLGQLYPPNEVFVAAEKRADDDEISDGATTATDEAGK
jgi:hypothetical protein